MNNLSFSRTGHLFYTGMPNINPFTKHSGPFTTVCPRLLPRMAQIIACCMLMAEQVSYNPPENKTVFKIPPSKSNKVPEAVCYFGWKVFGPEKKTPKSTSCRPCHQIGPAMVCLSVKSRPQGGSTPMVSSPAQRKSEAKQPLAHQQPPPSRGNTVSLHQNRETGWIVRMLKRTGAKTYPLKMAEVRIPVE